MLTGTRKQVNKKFIKIIIILGEKIFLKPRQHFYKKQTEMQFKTSIVE